MATQEDDVTMTSLFGEKRLSNEKPLFVGGGGNFFHFLVLGEKKKAKEMPIRTSIRKKSWKRRSPVELQWTEAKAMRDAAAMVARRAPVVVGPNPAQRGLQLAQGEFKSVDVVNGADLNTTGFVTLLNGMTRGDDISQRIGREVTLRSVQLTYQIGSKNNTGTDQYVRVMLVYDRQANGSTALISDILSGSNTYAPRNLENRHRFSILYDRMIAFNASGEPGSRRVLRFYRRLNHPVTFNGNTGGTIADIQTGALYFVAIGSNPAGATDAAGIMQTRVRYQDK